MPVLTDTRLAYLRYTTKQYILDEPTTIVLKRQVKVNKPGGGHDFPKVALPAQIFRFVNQDIGSGISLGSDEGIARRFNYVLIGKHDADIDINDTWEDGVDQYKVDSLVPNNGFEVRANIVGFSVEPEHG